MGEGRLPGGRLFPIPLCVFFDSLAVLLTLPPHWAPGSQNSFYPPSLPPSRFHNAQTISLSVVLGLATLFYGWRRAATPALRREFMGAAAFVSSIYWLCGLAAILFPGTMGLDPEFGGPGFPQAPLFVGFSLCGLVGSWLEA